MRNVTRYLIITIFIIPLLIGCDTTEPLIDHFNPNGTYNIQWNDLSKIGNTNLKLGGFTGLYFGGKRDFYTITGRGPVVQTFDENGAKAYFVSPSFVPRIIHLELQDDHSAKVVESFPIKAPTGKDISGLPPAGVWSDDETITNNEQLTDDWGLFPGGVYYDINNHFFWIADQYNPGILQLTVNGEWVKRLRPGEGYRLNFAKHTVNGGFTGIDFDRFGNIITVMGRALEHNRNVNDPVQSRPINYSLRRIAQYVPGSNVDYSFFYFVERQNLDGIPERFVELSDIVSVNDTSFLVLEEGECEGLRRSLLFEAVINDSTSKVVEGLEGLDNKTFETLDSEEWEANGLKALHKNLLVDLIGEGLRKVEGMAIVDSRHLAVIENNNFGIKSGNPNSGEYQVDNSSIKLKIIELPKKLDVRR
jgi:hypothetical protein